MGLDGVELVMAVEEEFDIELTEEDAVVMVTFGQMVDTVFELVPEPSKQVVEQRLRKVVCDILSVPPDQVQRETRFVEDLDVG